MKRKRTDTEKIEKARSLRRQTTVSEKVLWSKLRGKQFRSLKFRRQHPLLGYIVDFYCHELKLVIEIDGPVHNNKNVRESDKYREQILTSNGYRVIRFKSHDVECLPDEVIKELERQLNNS